jgi:hypothetical protein
MSCPSPVKHKFLGLHRGVCHFHGLNPHHARTTCCDPMARVREVCPRRVSGQVCKGATPRRGRGIDSGELGQAFGRGCGGKLGGHCCHPRKVEAPDALCAADHPWPRRRGRTLWERLLPRQARDPELRRRAAAIWSFAAADKGDEEGDSAHKEATDGDPFAVAAVEGLPGPDGQTAGQTSFLEESGLLEDAT